MASPSNQALLETATRAAREAGLHALREAHRANEYHALLPHDLKLVLDKESQDVAETHILSPFPHMPFAAKRETPSHRHLHGNGSLIRLTAP